MKESGQNDEKNGVIERIEAGIHIIRLDRVEKKNAITLNMYQTLSRVLLAAAQNDAVSVSLIYGAGRDFSSGNDINEFSDLADSPEKMAQMLGFLDALSQYPKPLIAAVEGCAIGVGATMLLHCDMVLSSREARLQFPFVQLGLAPEAASSYLLPQLIGHQRAFELLVLGETFNATEAYKMALVNHLCEEGEAYKLALVYAERIAALPKYAVTSSKALLKGQTQKAVAQSMEQEAHTFQSRLHSFEARQAFDAFLSRNK